MQGGNVMIKQLMKVFILLLLFINIVAGGVITSIESNPQKVNSPRATAKIYIDPQNITANVGDNFTISVKIANVTNLTGFSIQLRWGTAVLKCVDNITLVPVETYPTGILHEPVSKNIDMVDETASITDSAPGTTFWTSYFSFYVFGGTFNGSGTVANLTFQVLRDGECDIYFTYTQLSDNQTPAQNITHTREHGYFYRQGLGEVPVADFTFSPEPAIVNKTVTFDASASYDPDGGNIALYIWNFGDGTIENTTNPIITHNFTEKAGPGEARGPYLVELTVLDDQNITTPGGSQSKPKHKQLTVVDPKPVAEFTFQPSIAVKNKTVTFNASASYDPDPDGNITDYYWNFGDGTLMNTTNPIITYAYERADTYFVDLTVKDDSDNLLSEPKTKQIEVVERRDIEVISVTASPSEVKQGEDVTVNVAVANKGKVDENFTLTAYYNSTATRWFKFDQLNISDFPKQHIPRWELTPTTSLNSTVNNILEDWTSGPDPQIGDTTVKVGNETGFWTINPGKLNNATGFPSLIPEDPLTTGGWIWGEELSGAKPINGEFSAGNWSFIVRLNATEANITATIWVRILKSNDPNPQTLGATVTVLKDWSRLFDASVLPAAPSQNRSRDFYGNVSVPSTTFANEYLYFEFQLEVTENNATNADTEVIFWVGGPTGETKSQITGTTFNLHKQYTFTWDTYGVSGGNYKIKVNATEVPHETIITNNIAYSNNVNVTEALITPSPLDVKVDVGKIYFRGEIAKFYILVSREGERVNASVTGFILPADGTISPLNPADFESIATGVYLLRYEIPIDATAGTYVLVVDAVKEYPDYTQSGTDLESFLISSTFISWNATFTGWNATFAGWNAILTGVEDDIATIITSLGEIQANLTTINATLSSLVVDSKDEILATIDTALGPVIARLDAINVTVTNIEGNTVAINSTLGEAEVSLSAVQLIVTVGLAVASILSTIAAVIAILIFIRIRKFSK